MRLARAPVPMWQRIESSDEQLPLRRGPSSTAIPSVWRLLSNQLHHGCCWRSRTYTTRENCRSAAWMPAKGSKIPASVKHDSPRESSRSEPSDLVQLSRSVVIVAGAQNAGSALGVDPVTGRVGRHYAWVRVVGLAPDFCSHSVRPGRSDLPTRDHAELPGTVDLAHSGADLDLWPDRSDGAI